MGVIVRSSNSANAVVEAIVELIQERQLQVGDKLPPIRELAALLDKKINVVRDGLLQAEARGLVNILPRAGAFVQQTAPLREEPAQLPGEYDFSGDLQRGAHNIFHLLDARRAIELELGQQAVERRRLEDLLPIRQSLEAMSNAVGAKGQSGYVQHDIQFHLRIAALGGNSVLLAMLEAILEQLRPWLERLRWDQKHHAKADRLHAELYRTLVEADVEAFRREMRCHLSVAYDSLLDLVRTPPDSL